MTTDGPAAQPVRQFTEEELAAAREQIAAQEAPGAGPGVTPQEMGTSLVAAGAEAAAVDPHELLALIRGMQTRIDGLEAEKRLAAAPQLTRLATAVSDHLAAKAAANPVIHGDPDRTWQPALDIAGELVDAAKSATESGDPSKVSDRLGTVLSWVTAHARQHPALDYNYVIELIGQAGEEAAKLTGQ